MNTPIHALIVDDNPMERALLSGLLKKIERWSILPFTCATGEEALQLAQQHNPDLAFIDYRLDHESGTDLIRLLKAMGSQAGCILFTGTQGDEALLEAIRVGADDYLRKDTLNIEALHHTIHHVLEKRQTALNLQIALDELKQAKKLLEKRVETDATVITEVRERLDAIASAAYDPILILDPHMRVIFWNPAASRVFGYSPEEILEHSVLDLLPPSDFATRLERSFQTFRQTGKGTMIGRVTEFTVKRKNGKTFPVEASSAAIQIQQAWHVVVILRDVTRHRKAEAALRKAMNATQQATRLKDQFVSLVAHDLRGPFTSILGFLELLEHDTKNPLNKKQKDYLHWITESSGNMLGMIDEILDISRLKTGKIVPELRFFNAHFLGTKALDSIRPIAEQKGIELSNELPESFRLYADIGLFGEVLHNLLTNAVKFSRQGDRITLFRPPEQPSTLAVRDTGIGIRKKRLAKLFKLEEKTSTVGTAGEHGTGYGLPFSWDLMRAHHGTLTVQSQENNGTVFFAQLPMVTPCVMIIDDAQECRQLLLGYLRSEQVQPIESTDGISALKTLKKQPCHLIICDVQMPGMNGFDFLTAVRKEPKLREIPIILITADDTIETRATAFRLGANDFITKPFPPQEFIPRIRRFLG